MRLVTATHELTGEALNAGVLVPVETQAYVLTLPCETVSPTDVREVVAGKLLLTPVALTAAQCVATGVAAMSMCIYFRQQGKGDYDVVFKTFRVGADTFHACYLQKVVQ